MNTSFRMSTFTKIAFKKEEKPDNNPAPKWAGSDHYENVATVTPRFRSGRGRRVIELSSPKVRGLLMLLVLFCPSFSWVPDVGSEWRGNEGVLFAAPMGSNLLAPAELQSPRQTVQTFYKAMTAYKKSIDGGADSEVTKKHLDLAIRTLDLSLFPLIVRGQKGRESAVFLKEVIDRIVLIKNLKIPDEPRSEAKEIKFWRFPNTEISINKRESGARQGDFLFSADAVYRAEEFFLKISSLPYLNGSGGGARYEQPWLERNIPQWSREKTLGVFRWQWFGFFVSIFLGLFLRSAVRRSLRVVHRMTEKSAVKWDDEIIQAVDKPAGYLAAASFWYFSLNVLRLEGFALAFFVFLVQLIFSYSIIWLVYRLVDVLSGYLSHIAKKTESGLDDQLVPLVSKAVRVFIVVFGALIAVQNLGVNVMSLLAGLGLGGLAFALAAKDTASNLFGSIMILWDQPFRVGDWIVVSGAEGTVEQIGFRSTRIRTFYDSQISIPNSQIANVEIDNMGRRQFRRVRMMLGVTYDTTPEQIELFLEGVKNIIKANSSTRKDYFHVVFSGYGVSSLDIMVYFFLDVPDWSRELVAKQNINLEILRLAKELQVDFAFPTQSLHVESFPEKNPVRKPLSFDVVKAGYAVKEFGPGGKSAKPEGVGLFVPPHSE